MRVSRGEEALSSSVHSSAGSAVTDRFYTKDYTFGLLEPSQLVCFVSTGTRKSYRSRYLVVMVEAYTLSTQ